ncbi:endonuclease/exonuclease/phosphatase family protein [Blastococcus sp. SYSU D00813]
MTPDRPHRLRSPSLLAVESVLVAALASGAGATAADAPVPLADAGDGSVTVMTRNLYVGTGVGDVFGARSQAELVAAGSRAWADLLASDFPARAEALADEVAAVRPDVVGLQEATLWRTETPGDVLTRPAPDATTVVFDFVAILRAELAGRGLPYTVVATSTNADVEFPRADGAAAPADLRLTDRDVLLVRTDRADRAGDARDGRYTAQFVEPVLLGPVGSTRGWTAVDYRLDAATTVRVLNTHLEVFDPATGTTQQQQAAEFLALVAASPHPVVALGDFNSPADGSGTPVYRDLTARLTDAWAAARPGDPGWTCCQTPSLADPVGRQAVRLDLVLVSGGLRVDRVTRTGDRPFRAAPPPLWASDHLGVAARVSVPG